jgi:3-oxoacyl-[acyl-carrier protein] reductase
LAKRAGPEFADHLIPLPLDVTDFEKVNASVRKIIADHGCPTALITAAGNYGAVGDVVKTSPSAWKEVLEVNLMGVYNFCHCVLPCMVSAGKGAIVNIAGGGASGPLEHLSAYGVSKAAIVRLTDSIANEVHECGIRANAVLPGPVDSPMQDQLLAAGEGAGHWYAKIKALRDRGEGGVSPERTVALIDFLLYGRGQKLTGKLLSARYDRFEDWTNQELEEIANSPMFSLRRIDPAALSVIAKTHSLRTLKA